MSKWKCEICGKEFDNFHAQGFDNKIYCPLCYFKKENQELKKQLNEKMALEMKLKEELEDKRKEYQEVYKDVREEIKDYKNQQKEFIKWLENYIDGLKDQQDNIEGLDIVEEHTLMTLEEVLEKHKEIIGGDNKC